MELDRKTIAFLAVAAFLSLLFICCIILSVLLYVRYRKSQVQKDDKEKKEKERLYRLKQKLLRQFSGDLRKQMRKRQEGGPLEVWQKERSFISSFRSKQGKVTPVEPPDDIETACSICLDSLAFGDVAHTVLALLTNCGHVYHMDCVWEWLERDRSCPICRRPLQMTLADLKAVTVYHVFNNFDIPSIRESVTQPDLQSRLGMEVVSMYDDDGSKASRSRFVVPVTVAPAPDGDTVNVTGISVLGSSSQNAGFTQQPLYPPRMNSNASIPSYTNPSFDFGTDGDDTVGANPSVRSTHDTENNPHGESPA